MSLIADTVMVSPSYRPRYTQEEWLRIRPGYYGAVFGQIRPIVRVKARSYPLRWSDYNRRWEVAIKPGEHPSWKDLSGVYYGGPRGGGMSDFQMGELLG